MSLIVELSWSGEGRHGGNDDNGGNWEQLSFYKDIKVILQVQEMFQAEKAVYMEVLRKEKLFEELKADQSDKVWKKQRMEWNGTLEAGKS